MEITYALLSFLSGGLATYLTNYITSKGKNRALKEDLANLEHEKQKVIAKYKSEIEDLKKQHTLDVEKRKHQYSEKKHQFIKFFSLLDEYHKKSNAILTKEFQPIIENFFIESIHCDDNGQAEIQSKFVNDLGVLFNKLNEELIKVRTETNTIRIISSRKMDALIDDLEAAIEIATNDAHEMIKFMGTTDFLENQALLIPLQEKIEESGSRVEEAKKSIRFLMKIELEEI